MRITESTLRKIIREELDAVVSETANIGKLEDRIVKAQLDGGNDPAAMQALTKLEKQGKYNMKKLTARVRAAKEGMNEADVRVGALAGDLEAEGMDEANGDFQYGSMRGDRFLDTKEYSKNKEKLMMAIVQLVGGTDFAKRSNVRAVKRHFEMSRDRAAFQDSVNKIIRGESTPEKEAEDLMQLYKNRIRRARA